MGTHPSFSSSGPSATYQPKTTDETDSTVLGGVVPHVNVQGPILGTLADATTPDPSANGASTSLVSLLRGIAANGFALISRLPASLGAKVSAASLSMVPASDAVFPAPADQDPIYDHTNGTKTSVTASALIITPPTGCKYLRISADADIVVNTAGIATVADDGTAARIVANAPEIIPVSAGVAVKALSLSGTAVVRCTPLKLRS